jgi:uncharacterized protein YkwD
LPIRRRQSPAGLLLLLDFTGALRARCGPTQKAGIVAMSTQVASELEQHVAASINSERAAAGLPALKVEAHLNAAAQDHSDWMGETGSFTHAGEDDSSPTDRIGDAGFPLTGSWGTAENIAYTSIEGNLDTEEVDRMHEGLMNSPEHRANILNPDVSYLGVGISVGHADGVSEPVAYMTEDFGDTDGRTLVQEESGGETVFQPYEAGEPVGEAQPAVSTDDPGTDDPGTDDPGTDPDNPDDEDKQAASTAGCFVATAAYGSYEHADVVALRRFKDGVLDRSAAGRAFVRFYWAVGPRLARLVSAEGRSGRAARTVIAPLARLARRHMDRRG